MHGTHSIVLLIMSPTKLRNAVFTWNNPPDNAPEHLRNLVYGPLAVATYCIFGKEVGDSGTPHLQGYIEFTSRTQFSTARRVHLPGCHIEPRRGTQAQAIEYCKKDGEVTEYGSPKKQGKRTDLEAIQREIDAGATALEIADEHFSTWVTYRRSFAAYRQLKVTPRTWPFSTPDVYFIHGATGVGKTHSVYESLHQQLYRHIGSKTFFDGYQGHNAVLFDDVDPNLFTPYRWLQLLDKYPLDVEIKGGTTPFVATVIIITSNLEPRLFTHGWDPGHVDAFMRRITHVVEL